MYAAENGNAYSGSQLTLCPRSFYHERVIVNDATDLSKFGLASEEKEPRTQYFELIHNSEKNAILIKGLPVPVEWYDENERRLTGSGYPDTLTAGTVISKNTEDFPVGPAVAGKAFLDDWCFKYWYYTSNQFEEEWSDYGVKKNATHIEGPLQFKAMYADAYTVTFDANNGEGAMDKQQYIRGQSQKPLSANTFTNGEMSFIGWNTAPDGSGTAYTDKQYLKFDSFTADVTLYAQWMPAHRHDVSTDCGVSDDSVDFTIWTSLTSLPTSSGRYVLVNDVTLKQWSLNSSKQEIVICLNGHSVTFTGISSGIYLSGQNHITICDCAEVPGKITRASNSTKELIDFSSSSDKATILGGVFSWCADKKFASSWGTVSIQGGIFSGNPDPDNRGYVPSGKTARPIAPSDPGYQDEYAGYYTIAGGPAVPAHTHAVSASCSTSDGKQETFLPLDKYSRAGAGNYYLIEDIDYLYGGLLDPNMTGTVNLCLNGHTVSHNGFNIDEVRAGVTLNICDCQSTGKISTGTKSSNLFTIHRDGTMNLYGGALTSEGPSYSGILVPGGTLNMHGGSISGCKGCAVDINGDGTFHMTGGSISGNAGGGVHVVNSAFIMEGGEITGNIGYGVDADSSGASVILSGSPVITGNTKDGKAHNLEFGLGKTITIAGPGLSDGARIGVTSWKDPTEAAPVDVTAPCDVDYSHCFFSDSSEYAIQDGSNHVVQLVKAAAPAPHTCAGMGESVTFDKAVTGATILSESGNYYLPGDLVLGGDTLTIGAGASVKLCLNGHTVEYTKESGNAIHVEKGGSLALCDCQGGGSIVSNGENAVFLEGDSFTMYGGSITSSQGNGLTVSGGFVDIHNGEIAGGKAGLWLLETEKVSLSGGTYRGTGSGKAIAIAEGGSIQDLLAPGYAYMDAADQTVTDGSALQNAQFLKVEKSTGEVEPPPPTHTHAWDTAWTSNSTHHWHNCTAEGCTVTEDAQKDGYGAHSGGTVCTVCGYTRTMTYDISGTVLDSEESPVEGAAVRLMRGRETISESVTAADGSYSFTGVSMGVYNVVAEKDGVTKTILVVLTDANAANQTIKMPDGKKNSVVEFKGDDTPAAVVGGVDEIAESYPIHPGDAVTVTLTVEKKEAPADKAEIETAAQGKTVGMYLDLSLLMTVQRSSGDNSEDLIPDTGDKVLEIRIPYDFQNKTGVTVYRKHGEEPAAALEALASPSAAHRDGTFYADAFGGWLHIYAAKFSTYASAYDSDDGDPSEPVGPAVYTLTVNGGTGSGSYAAGAVVNISAAVPSGKRFTSWTGAAVANTGSAHTTLVMPAQDVTVTANFEDARKGSSLPETNFVSIPPSGHGKITTADRFAAEGERVSLSVHPDKGYALSSLTVTAAGGKEITVREKGDGKYSFTMPNLQVKVAAEFEKIQKS